MADLTISAVAEKFHVKPDTLRYYERIGLLPPVPRRTNGNRYYPPSIQEWLEMVLCFRASGMAIEPLIKYCSLLQQGDETAPAREKILQEQLAVLLTQREQLDKSIHRLEGKVARYERGEVKVGADWLHFAEKKDGRKWRQLF